MKTSLLALLLAVSPAAADVPDASGKPAEAKREYTDAERKERDGAHALIAFVGDSYTADPAKAVFAMAAKKNVDALFHLGDFDYKHNPDLFGELLDRWLGEADDAKRAARIKAKEDFPEVKKVLAAMGNHEVDATLPQTAEEKAAKKKKVPDAKRNARLRQEYSDMLDARRPAGAQCEGEPGVMQACSFQGLFVVFVTPDIFGDQAGHADYIDKRMEKSAARWKICAWHKPSTKLQAGNNGDGVKWSVYEACRKHGAIIATAHEHGYSRTFVLESFKPITASAPDAQGNLVLEPGKSLTFVSAAGGAPFRAKGPNAGEAWQAKVYMSGDNPKGAGALFCEFGKGGADKARCWFEDIDGSVIDDFTLQSKL
jgi:hypothetical protein